MGENEIYLSDPLLLERGQFIFLTQITGRIAIDTTTNNSYSDLFWNSATKWTKLALSSNWRFYLKPIITFKSYTSVLRISHRYNNIGIYNISFTFLNTGETIKDTINITDGNF